MADWFIKELVLWYATAQRILPWRGTTDPYKVWLSEVILQQTRVVQGLPYYQRFIAEFPTVVALAKAPEEQVLKLWQGLGYYSRAKNLHHTAQYITDKLGGEFPKTYNELIKLKGIGDYTASAIASFCYDEPRAVLDGNVYRVLSRLWGIATPINTPEGTKEFRTLANELLDKKQPATYNQALMEFGALVCTPQAPNCNDCIFQNRCWAYQHQQVTSLPVKLKKISIKKRYFNYLVWLTPDKKTCLQKRTTKDIWQGLYEFPLIESKHPVTYDEMAAILAAKYPLLQPVLYNENPVIHKLTHQHIYTSFWVLMTAEPLDNAIFIADITAYPVAALTAKFIEDFWQL